MATIEKYRKAAEAGENEFSNFVNYGVKKKPEGDYKRKRILVMLGYAVFAIAFAAVCISTKIVMLIALLPVLTWILVFFTWHWVNIEYEYQIINASLKLMEVYGNRYMKQMCDIKISTMSIIAPYNGEYRAMADDTTITERIYGVSSMDNPDVYFAICHGNNGEKRVIFFEATEKTLKAMKYYNQNVVMSKTTH
ncbi:MAG: hypothetical protein HFE63_00125 [Clostridiales bacterium]|nr:hypothetical protein [Clostridiales bacterium]